MQLNDCPLTACKISILLLFIASLVPAQGSTVPDERVEWDGADSLVDLDSTSQKNPPETLIDPSDCNHPPEQPYIADGPISGAPGVTCNYTAYAIDPDGDPLIYIFHWDDGNSSTVGPFESEAMAAADHIWRRAGIYQVRVRAMDDNASSPWSSPWEVVVNSPPGQPVIPAGKSTILPREMTSFATSAEDPEGDKLRYIFDWGDGFFSTTDWTESGRALSIAHSWQRAGRYMIAARAEDSANASSLWSSPREVVVNSPPGQPAIPAGKSTILPGEITSFATSAEDPDGDRLRYIFHWGDGSFSTTDWTESGRALRIAHSWQRAGRYMIAAKAEDSANASSPWSEAITIIINTLPGRPDQPSGPGSGYAMVPYNFQTSAIDQDGDSLNYTFDWGDGTTLDLDLIGSGINVSSNHTWTVPGTYQIKAIALDRMGGEWSEERSITIAANEQPDPPRDLYGLRSSYTGIVCNYFTMTKDPDGDNVMHLLDWGDGTITETGHIPSGSLENASHTWSRPGEYPVRVCSLDDKGAPSQWSGPFLVSISANDPPEQPTTPSGPAAGQCLISHEYATSARDPDGDAVKYIFDWGDGTTSWTGLEYLDSGEESSVSHKWMQPGAYQIKAAALDDKGLISNWSGALAVKIE